MATSTNFSKAPVSILRLIFTILLLTLSTSPSLAKSIRMTIYDDGKSCPASYNAHVVFKESLNGTTFAHDPGTPKAPFKKCSIGSSCEICFDDKSRTSCMKVEYQGGGPHADTFDFTPNFYKENCPNTSIPNQLKIQCAALDKAAKPLAKKTNCIQNPSDPKCIAIIKTAETLQTADLPLYDQCKKEGEAKFNRGRPIGEQRSNDCAYEKKGTGGPNSKGNRWRRLLPGACRTGTYVGKDGLDCCTGIIVADGPLGSECRNFYP